MFFPPTKNTYRAFTLIELLVVITIIGVLVGLLLPVVNAVSNNSRKTQASSDEARIMTASASYQADYGKMPLGDEQFDNPDGNGNYQDTVYGNPGGLFSSAYLFNILRAIASTDGDQRMANIGNKYNPRQVVYLQGNNAKNPSDPRSGFLTQDHNDGNYTIMNGAMVDPWGSEYVVWFDRSGDGDLNTAIRWFYGSYPQSSQPYPLGPGPGGPVQVASMGPDGNFGKNGRVTGSDDVVTW